MHLLVTSTTGDSNARTGCVGAAVLWYWIAAVVVTLGCFCTGMSLERHFERAKPVTLKIFGARLRSNVAVATLGLAYPPLKTSGLGICSDDALN